MRSGETRFRDRRVPIRTHGNGRYGEALNTTIRRSSKDKVARTGPHRYECIISRSVETTTSSQGPPRRPCFPAATIRTDTGLQAARARAMRRLRRQLRSDLQGGGSGPIHPFAGPDSALSTATATEKEGRSPRREHPYLRDDAALGPRFVTERQPVLAPRRPAPRRGARALRARAGPGASPRGADPRAGSRARSRAPRATTAFLPAPSLGRTT